MKDNRELIIFGVLIFAAIAACFLFAYWQVHVSQEQWCTVLNTLTRNPVPKPADPAANPSRVEAYTLYQEFVSLRGNFGCG